MEKQSQNNKNIVIFILGTTGVGKSKLSLDLAEKLNGEIVNADSMQIYSGNDGIMTAKPTSEEKSRVKHHLYDVLDMFQKDFNVNKYQELALASINDIQSRGKIPVVVGGTNYYIESLFIKKVAKEFHYEEAKFNETFDHCKKSLPDFADIIEDFKVNIPIDNKAALEDKYDSEALHRLLQQVDQKMSEFLHSNDKRRIVNALFKYFKYMHMDDKKMKESEIQMHQKGIELRYLPIFIWMSAKQEILEQRIWKRIQEMIHQSQGLREIFSVFKAFEEAQQDSDFEKGILQAIGYKEFHSFYQYVIKKYGRWEDLLEDGMKFDEEDLKELELSKERLKSKTIQYTIYQIKWLTKRIGGLFSNGSADQNILLKIQLDDPKLYEQIALERSLEFVNEKISMYDSWTEEERKIFLQNYCQEFALKKAEKMSKWQKQFCEKCKQELNGEKQWEEHVKTRKHKNRMRGDKKQFLEQKKEPKISNASKIEDDLNNLDIFDSEDI